MKKVIASMNITLDGYCDHTAMTADAELHEHFTQQLNNGGSLLYGRTTYQLIEDFWPTLVKTPSGEKDMDDFAVAIDNIPKIVFSNTMKSLGWKSARLATTNLSQEISGLKEKPGKDILIGSPSLIAQAAKLNLIDEYQLCIHPVIAGRGLVLFKDIADQKILKLIEAKTFGSGVILVRYKPNKKS